jgi:hypothetical protein
MALGWIGSTTALGAVVSVDEAGFPASASRARTAREQKFANQPPNVANRLQSQSGAAVEEVTIWQEVTW